MSRLTFVFFFDFILCSSNPFSLFRLPPSEWSSRFIHLPAQRNLLYSSLLIHPGRPLPSFNPSFIHFSLFFFTRRHCNLSGAAAVDPFRFPISIQSLSFSLLCLFSPSSPPLDLLPLHQGVPHRTITLPSILLHAVRHHRMPLKWGLLVTPSRFHS